MYVIAAAVLAAVSPAIASLRTVVDLSDPSLFDWWFLVLPLTIDMVVSTDPAYRIPLWIAVYAVQYLALFAVTANVAPLVRVARDFIGPPRHRGGLLRR
jgi:hypothetical protein